MQFQVSVRGRYAQGSQFPVFTGSNLEAVLPIPLLGAGMERNVPWRRLGVLPQLAYAGVGIFPVNFIFAGVDRIDDSVGVFVR